MDHEYRHADGSEICQGCGQPWYFCKGKNAGVVQTRPYARSEWEIWCAKYGIDPDTPDETLLDAFLHYREPILPFTVLSMDEAEKCWAESMRHRGVPVRDIDDQPFNPPRWDDPRAKREVAELERLWQL